MDAQAGRLDRQIALLRAKWAEQLLTASDALCRAPGHLVSSIAVTYTFDGTAENADWLEDLSRRVAEEYGLQALVQVGVHFATVNFGRIRKD